MSNPLRSSVFASPHPVIAMLHLLPLPGAPRFRGDMQAVRDHLLRDVDILTATGVDGLMLENFGDTPFYPGRVPAGVVAQMTALAAEVRKATPLPLGVNVLRNDGCSAVAIAHAVGAQFIRVNILSGARVTDQGIINGIAHELLRERAALNAEEIQIFADVNVKHSVAVSPRPLEEEVADTVSRGGADALIVSGTGTGCATPPEELARVRAAAPDTPLFVGSGVAADNVAAMLRHADGVIVGTSLKRDGKVTNPVDPARVAALLAAIG